MKNWMVSGLVVLLAGAAVMAGGARDDANAGPKVTRSRRLGGRVPARDAVGRGEEFVLSVSWSPGGKLLAASGSLGYGVRVWNASTGREVCRLPVPEGNVRSVAWSPDGKLLAATAADNTVRIWRAAKPRVVRTLGQPEKELDPWFGHGCVRWSPDGTHIATVGTLGKVHLWNVATGVRETSLSVNGDIVAWSPAGSQLAVANWGGDTIRVLDTTTGREERVVRQPAVAAVVWSPDGRRLATASALSSLDSLQVWDVTTGKPLWSQQGSGMLLDNPGWQTAVASIAWSADGRYLASGGADRKVRIWNAASGQKLVELQEFREYEGPVSVVAWSPDGKHLACGAGAGIVQVWDLALPHY